MIKQVAVIQDLSGLGKCSLTAALPVLSVLGVQACPLPTAVLTNQTGYGSYYCDDYTDRMDYFTEEWQKLHLKLDGIYTGFLGNEAQTDKIFHFMEVFRKPDTLVLTDPVMGDNGAAFPFFTPRLLSRLTELALAANVIIPNLTECCLLAGQDYEALTARSSSEEYFRYIGDTARKLLGGQLQTVLVTGIIAQPPGTSKRAYYNLAVTEKELVWASSGMHGGSYSGTGDLLASVICGCLVKGEDIETALKKAVRFLEAALTLTENEQTPRNDGVAFEPCLGLLLD